MTTTEYRSPRGTVGLITDASEKPLWLYALERGNGGRYAIVWIFLDTPTAPRALVGTESGVSKWMFLPDLVALGPEQHAGAEALRQRLRLQGGKPFLLPGAGALVYADSGDVGFRQAQVFFDPYLGGAPTLLAQIGRAPETPTAPPADGIRVTPREAVSLIGLAGGPQGDSDVAFADTGGATPAAPTAPPEGFGGPIGTGAAVPVLILLGLAGVLLLGSMGPTSR